MSFQTTIPILSIDQTTSFVKQMDLAARLLDVTVLKEIIERFQLQHLDDTAEFLEDAPEKFGFGDIPEEKVQVTEVLPFPSKCIACVYGKTVKGYIIRFSVAGPAGSRINYRRNFAMNFLIKDQQLADFGWCHSFLHPEEMEELDEY